jgi:hypothetical protein
MGDRTIESKERTRDTISRPLWPHVKRYALKTTGQMSSWRATPRSACQGFGAVGGKVGVCGEEFVDVRLDQNKCFQMNVYLNVNPT